MTYSSDESRPDMGHDLFKGMTKKKKIKESKKAPAPPIQTGEHGRYQIKSGRLSGTFVARAFAKPPTKSRGLIAEASGATEEAAIAALHEAIDARETRRAEDRRIDPRTGAAVPSTEEYIEALSHVALTRPQRAMLTALSLADPEGLSEARLAHVGGYKSQASAKRSFASACTMIAKYLSLETNSSGALTSFDGNSCAGYMDESKDDGKPGNWILHPEMRDAVRVAL